MLDIKPRRWAVKPPPDQAEQERIYAAFNKLYLKRCLLAFGFLLSIGIAPLMMWKLGMWVFLLPLVTLVAIWKPLLRDAKCPYCGNDFRQPGTNKSMGGTCYSCGVRLKKNFWI